MSGKWFTREDIVRDLTQAGSCVLDADNLGIVVAGRPPPPLRFNDDAEEAMQREYYGASATDNGIEEYVEPPDIASIQRMLRLVHEIEENNDEEARRHWAQKQELTKSKSEPVSTDEIVLISKLNPDVPQFVPRSVKCKSTNVTVNPNGINEQISTIKEKTSNELCPDAGRGSHLNYGRVSPKMCSEELKKITTELKNKIKNVTEADSLRNKKSRNLAISTLLKLMSSSSKPSTPTESRSDSPKFITRQHFDSTSGSKHNVNNEKSYNSKSSTSLDSLSDPPKLTTHQHFDSPSGSKHNVNNEKSYNSKSSTPVNCLSDHPNLMTRQRLDIPIGLKHNVNNEKSYNSKSSTSLDSLSDPPKVVTRKHLDIPSGSKHNVNNEKSFDLKINSSKIDASPTMNSPKHEMVKPNKESFDPDVDKNIKESIEKVNEWLNKPDSPKVTSDLVFHSGPVTYKKKDTNSVPSESKVTEEKIPEKQLKCKEYEPSEGVDELCKQFMERIKVRESQDDIWTKLERQLKERDELIKNGKLEKRKSRKRVVC